MTVPAKTAPTPGEIIENVIVKGDLSKLSPDERARYYVKVCESVGLNPLTRPFEYITLQGKLTLYAKRDCADQLRRLHGISIEIVSQVQSGDIYTVHVRASDRAGRIDEDFGTVTLPPTLRGDARGNAILKAITKAKRRVTLSISGLGFVDETEIADIPAQAKQVFSEPKTTPPLQVVHDPAQSTLAEEMNDEIPFGPAGNEAEEAAPASRPPQPSPQAGAADYIEMAREAAMRGREVFNVHYKNCTREQQAKLREMKAELETLMPAGE